MNIVIHPLSSSWSTSSSFQDISNKENTHISSSELLVYFIKLLRHIYQGTYSYILFGAPGLLPQAFKTYPIRRMFLYALWSSWSTSASFEDISIEEYNKIFSLKFLVSTLWFLLENTWFYNRKPSFFIWNRRASTVNCSTTCDKEYTHICSLEVLVYFPELLRHI